jgi:hypothetical protein
MKTDKKELPNITGGEWFRFLHPAVDEGFMSDEYDHDAEAEDREGEQ